ncbi:MAG TPA: DinB family protein [Promineifilum sp.]|nr:DinB family protein [Promineifilum sp.]HQF71195.1 DinB family protein [Promineifilum sp.]
MEQLFTDMSERLETLVRAIETAVDGVPAEDLDWKPASDMNSLAVLLTHTAGALRYWVGEVAGGQPAGRVRAQEFETHSVDADTLLGRLREALDHSKSVLANLSLAQLNETRVGGMDNIPHSAGWALLHALEHTGIHTGHIQMTRQLWDARDK